MATIVNNPPATTEAQSGGYGFLLGVIALIIFAALFFIYGLPMITNSMSQSQPQVTVPDKIDVNVNNPQK